MPRKKLSYKGISEALGANFSMRYEDGDNFFLIRVKKNEKWKTRKVYELSEEQAKNFKVHGPATGQGVGHCIYLADKYWKEFKEKVCGYRVVPSNRGDCPASVLFYSKD